MSRSNGLTKEEEDTIMMGRLATERWAAAFATKVPNDSAGFKRSQTGYVSANEGILPLCLLDSSHCLLSSVISCRVM